MRLALVLPALLLAACATEQPLEVRVQQASNAQLCEAVVYGDRQTALAAESEARSRGINCNDYAGAVQTLQQQRAAAAAAILSRPQPTYQPIPSPAPQQTRCTSRWVGDSWRTVCN